LGVTTRARAEWEPLRRVAVHRPGIEMWFGLLSPYASLYERAFNRYEARNEHERLVYRLRQEFRVDVVHLKEKMLEIADGDPKGRERFFSLAISNMEFAGDKAEALRARKQMKEDAPALGVGHFFNVLLLHPKLDLKEGGSPSAVELNVTGRAPLANLYFMRDQQATTDRGIFLSRMSRPQRRKEPAVTRFLWEGLGETLTHKTHTPGTFEGGDFIPMKDFALVGLGDRSNRAGVEQLLAKGVGFGEVGVVHQPSHPLVPEGVTDPMVNMHLDTYFNAAASNTVVGSELLLKRARVEVYHREEEGRYRRARSETTLHDYIKGKGFNIIDLTTLEQLSYAANFLCVKDGTILAVEVERVVKNVLASLESRARKDPVRYARLFEQAKKDYHAMQEEAQFFPHKRDVYRNGIDAFPLILTNLTGGYGGAHCMTAVLERG